MLLPLAAAADLPDVGVYDRYRVDIPDYPDAEATSPYGSVLLAPPPAGTPYRVEEAPVPDGYVPTETFEALATPPWHAAGVDGRGVKLAVFDVQWFNAELDAAELGAYTTHDCQAHASCDLPMDTLRPRYTFEEGSHGVACAEVVRDLAPGVELHLVRVNGGTTLETAGAWAAREGIDVVSMSMSFFNSSYYDGSGYISGAADRMLEDGVLLVGSAGNYATEHWDGPFEDHDQDGDNDFTWGSSYLPMWLSEPTGSVILAWDEFGACGDTDLDGWVYRDDGAVVGKGEARQSPGADSCGPVERIRVEVEEAGWYYLRVFRAGGSGSPRFSVFARDAEVYAPTPGGLADPAASRGEFTVGAVRVTDYATRGPEAFSSVGPTHGGEAKPQIAGPDGLTTSVYGPYGFYGTSASTPAVAALVALVMQKDGLDARSAAEKLQANALSGRATWEAWDGELGAGRARLWSPDAPGGCRGSAAWVFAPALLWWRSLRRRPLR